MLTIAIPKGRVLKVLAEPLRAAGVNSDVLLSDSRRLIREDPSSGLRFILLKPDDVPTYVEYGAADLGIVGRDVLGEHPCDLFVPLDLQLGRCRMIVAGTDEQGLAQRPLRVATKFTRAATTHFAALGVHAEIIFVQGSVELAPLMGLADVIVDLVETGETLKQNGLRELAPVSDISSVLIANRASYKLKHARIAPLVKRLARAVATQP